jgi:hypothetical protein
MKRRPYPLCFQRLDLYHISKLQALCHRCSGTLSNLLLTLPPVPIIFSTSEAESSADSVRRYTIPLKILRIKSTDIDHGYSMLMTVTIVARSRSDDSIFRTESTRRPLYVCSSSRICFNSSQISWGKFGKNRVAWDCNAPRSAMMLRAFQKFQSATLSGIDDCEEAPMVAMATLVTFLFLLVERFYSSECRDEYKSKRKSKAKELSPA